MKKLQVTGKVITGFILIGLALSVAMIFLYSTINNISDAVAEAGKPNARSDQWNKCVDLLYKAENKTRNWRLNQDMKELSDFDSIRKLTVIELSALRKLNAQSPRALLMVDSLSAFSDERFEILGKWISFSENTSTQPQLIDEILSQMTAKEKAFARANANQKEEKDSAQPEAAKKELSFWQRLVHGNHSEKSADIKDSVVAEKQEEKIPVIATNQLRKTILEGQEKFNSLSDSLVQQESALLKADQELMIRIHRITEEYQVLMSAEVSQRLLAVSIAASKGTRSIVSWFIGIAFVIIVFFIYFISRDVNRNKVLQLQLEDAKLKAEQLVKSKEDFLSNMSHEIRTPLNIISGFTSTLLKTTLDEKQESYANGIHRSSAHLISLVNDILDYSKIKSGKLQLEEIPFRLKDILQDLDAAFGTVATEKKLQFSVEMDVALPEVIKADPLRFRQILYNLISNSLKFTSEGFVKIQFKKIDGEQQALCITVQDSGIGIDKKNIETIFQEFEQADNSITRKYGGTGLGLSITRALLKEMKGVIDVQSEPGKGSTFIVKLPLVPSAISATEKIVPYDKTFLKGKKILICDDDKLNRMVGAHIIQACGGIVIESAGGKQTLEILENEFPDILLMDLHMPEMSGEETIKRIRASKNKTSSVKIIALTGRTKETSFSANSEFNVDGFIQKPYKEEDLLGEIYRILNAK